MVFRKVKKIGKILSISMLLLLLCAGAALAFNPPANYRSVLCGVGLRS